MFVGHCKKWCSIVYYYIKGALISNMIFGEHRSIEVISRNATYFL